MVVRIETVRMPVVPLPPLENELLPRAIVLTSSRSVPSNHNSRMPPRRNEPVIHGPEAYMSAVRDSGHAMRQQYEDDPLALAERLGLKLPEKPVFVMVRLGVITQEEADLKYNTEPGLRELVEDVCLLREESAVVVGPRGGGKSQGVSFIEFYLVFILMFDALNLGGSELQADAVYKYLTAYLNSDAYWMTLVKGEPLQSETTTVEGAWIRVLAASQKSVRSPHAGGRTKRNGMAGGVLVIDEEAEAAPDIVGAALFTVNTADPSINIRCSTFHNAEGTFAEVVEDHEDMGYKMYGWDIFDICRGDCGCTGDGCQSEEKCFREDHIEKFVNPDTGQEEEKLIHRAYCGGRAKYAAGWEPYREILKSWRRIKRSHAVWEVEAMGWRPPTGHKVIQDQQRWKANHVDQSGVELYRPGAHVTVCVDWGTHTAAISSWQEWVGDSHALLYAELVEEAGPEEMVGKVVAEARKWGLDFLEIAADIGGGGNYMNKLIVEQYNLPVRDVAFSEEKEAAAKAWNIYNDGGKIVIPNDVPEMDEQVKKWRRNKGRIVKADDHLCDTGICYFAKFIDRLNIPRGLVAPVVVSTGIVAPRASAIPSMGRGPVHTGSVTPRVAPVVVSRRR